LAKADFDSFCRSAFDFLAAARVRHLVIGGLAVVAIGEPRLTGDVDVIAYVTEADVDRLITAALDGGFELDASVERERFERTGTLRFRRDAFQLDLIRASLPFEDEAFRRSSLRRLFGRSARLPTPEDLILFKVLAGRDKDMLDATGVAKRHASALDLEYLRRTLRPICDLAQDAAPWHRLESVLQKAGLKL
jgi:hypothetical protein